MTAREAPSFIPRVAASIDELITPMKRVSITKHPMFTNTTK